MPFNIGFVAMRMIQKLQVEQAVQLQGHPKLRELRELPATYNHAPDLLPTSSAKLLGFSRGLHQPRQAIDGAAPLEQLADFFP